MKGRSSFLKIGLAVLLSFTLLVCFAYADKHGGGKKSTVTITPSSGVKGAQIDIAGSGFKAGEEIDIILIMGPGQRIGLGTEKVDAITADKAGAFKAQSNIPSWAQPGTYDIVVEGGEGSMAKTKIEVTAKQ